MPRAADKIFNVRSDFLTLEDARELIATVGATWEGSAFQTIAHREGWDIFNLVPDGDNTDAGIERFDDPREHPGCTNPLPFVNDEAAVQHCQARAHLGSDAHDTALNIEHALNSIRFHLWGAEWIDSRIGPETAPISS